MIIAPARVVIESAELIRPLLATFTPYHVSDSADERCRRRFTEDLVATFAVSLRVPRRGSASTREFGAELYSRREVRVKKARFSRDHSVVVARSLSVLVVPVRNGGAAFMVEISDINGTHTPTSAEGNSEGECMQWSSRVRQALVMTGVGSLVLATSVTAGAAGVTGKYSAAAAKLVPPVYKKAVLQVATDATYPPDESMKGTTIIGFDVDLINAIAKTLGIKVKENNVTFGSIIGGMLGGKYQIGNSSFTDNKQREKQVNFVDYFTAGEGVYAKASSKVKFTGLKSFCGLNIAVETGTVEQADAQTAAKACPSKKRATVLAFANQNEANTAVLAGRADVGFVDSQIAGYIVSLEKGTFKLLGHAINVAPYGIATTKNAAGTKLALAIKAAIKVLIANGTYGAILSKWGVSSGAIPASKVVLNGAVS